LGAAIEHDAGAEARANPALEVPEPSEVIPANGLCRLDFDAYDLAGAVFEHAVDFVGVTVSIVVAPG
jgi:hypothetical protein